MPLFSKHGPGSTVALDHTGTALTSLEQLWCDVAIVAAALPAPCAGSHVALVIDSDRYHFGVALVASWTRGHAVALPPNLRRDTVKSVVVRDDVVAVLHDTGAGIGQRVPDLLAADTLREHEAMPWRRPDREHAATLFTSGSTGAMRPWSKTFGQLLRETTTLAEVMGSDGVVTVATVPPAHLYGLLFSVLLPWSTGGALVRTTPFAPGAIAAAVRDTGARVLVSVPAHLRACTALEDGVLSDLDRIISSTAPMPAEIAKSLSRAHDVNVVEAFGSTETGGIATRVQTEGPAWRPLPGVQVALEEASQRLVVHSPFLHPDAPQPYVSDDVAQLTPDGLGFVHKGRADDVVKVGGRRVSLRAMASAALSVDAVEDAAATAVADTTGRGQRVLLAVAGDGVDLSHVRDALAARFDASTLPRSLKHLQRLPREANGKLLRAELLRVFGLAADGQPLVAELDWSEPQAEDMHEPGRHEVRFSATLPERYVMFQGHFPGYPVLAGAVQLTELVLPCVQRVRPGLRGLRELKGLKFTKRLAPGDPVTVVLRWTAQTDDRIDFEIRRDAVLCSSGKMRFGAA